MDLPIDHLRTLAAVVHQGSLEGAAKQLHITPSAVSQRIRGLEERVGSVLLRRTRPVSVTEAGAAVLRAARQVEQVVSDLASELEQGSTGGSLIPVVVNADSLATWFVPALARAARETGARFEVIRADETISTEKLQNGEAMAALTATREAVPGCTSSPIGVDRYYAVATPEFAVEYFASGLSAATLAAAPQLEFDRHDMFQQRFIKRITRARVDPPRHFVPSSAEFVMAIELGMGWGMVPRLQCAESLASGRLVEIMPGSHIDLPLYWQRWNLRSPVLDALSEVIADEARHAFLSPVKQE
ncbi:LysR family transcriptional regulator ArgP [Leucobacter denitrificans]|uniref:LysR family transcriptional regulator ArgP n=1 Tax=Leucobacter denitrificans TaxID=683042 RepID=A0A7G9S245_9MICO|nr:LysR family transcriptional regulator ArgP [Leucobacter denitrificans]QNN61920.1 LysR family transcriptional regulator ArgP [Leucobacter denitrificans]